VKFLVDECAGPVLALWLAREAGLASNTVGAGYLELLADLLCLSQAYAWDPSRRVKQRRKPSKVHSCNTLAAAAWHPGRPRSPADVIGFDACSRGAWYEWVVAQELWRRAAIGFDELPEETCCWQRKEHELDFVLSPTHFLEVKSGGRSPVEFAWFHRVFADVHVTVVSDSRYETGRITGITLEDFLLG
jgi:uncharacterized protein